MRTKTTDRLSDKLAALAQDDFARWTRKMRKRGPFTALLMGKAGAFAGGFIAGFLYAGAHPQALKRAMDDLDIEPLDIDAVRRDMLDVLTELLLLTRAARMGRDWSLVHTLERHLVDLLTPPSQEGEGEQARA